MRENFLISTGGSGGHVIPAIILYQHLNSKTNTIISTDKRGLKYFDNNAYEFKVVNTPKLNNIFLFPINFFIIIYLTIQSIHFLKKKKIEKVFSTGGYMSIPVIFAAKLLKLQIFLIEPNLVLGRANKFFLNFSKKIFCYSEKIKNFPAKFLNQMVIINPLVKENIYQFKNSSLKKSKFTLLIVGGSQGAKIFDENFKNSIVSISKKIPVKIIQQTSEKNISNLNNFYLRNNIESEIFTFDENFINRIYQADLCITRAGASTLAELSTINLPFIAVPLPSSKDNHQLENANYYKNQNCCWVLEQKNFEKKIEELLMLILNDKRDYLIKKENLEKLNLNNSWLIVNQKIVKAIYEN